MTTIGPRRIVLSYMVLEVCGSRGRARRDRDRAQRGSGPQPPRGPAHVAEGSRRGGGANGACRGGGCADGANPSAVAGQPPLPALHPRSRVGDVPGAGGALPQARSFEAGLARACPAGRRPDSTRRTPSTENLEALHAAAAVRARGTPARWSRRRRRWKRLPPVSENSFSALAPWRTARERKRRTWTAGRRFGGRTRDRERRAARRDRRAEGCEPDVGGADFRPGAGSRRRRGGKRRACGARDHRLQRRLAAVDGAGTPSPAEGESVPALESYADLPAWAERHFEGRVVLAGRALRALKSAGFEDVGLVGRAVEVLAGSYWRMKSGGGGKALRDAFEDELRELRLQETKSIGRGPAGQGARRLLDGVGRPQAHAGPAT